VKDAPGGAQAAGAAAAAGTSAQASSSALSPGSILREVEAALQEVLGRGLAPDEPLMSGGLDSLGAVEYVSLVGRWVRGG
jgi:hypothetical protein